MSTPSVGQVPIFTTSSGDPTPRERRSHCKISEDLAEELRILADLRAGERVVLRIGVTGSDVNTLYNPGYADFLGRSAAFVVDEIVNGSFRVEVHPNSGPGEKDGGVFALYGHDGNPFAGVSIPANARVTLSTLAAADGPSPGLHGAFSEGFYLGDFRPVKT